MYKGIKKMSSKKVDLKLHSEFITDITQVLFKYKDIHKNDAATTMDHAFLQAFVTLHYQGDYVTIRELHDHMEVILTRKQKELS